MSFPRGKRFDPRTASFDEAKVYFATQYGPYIQDAKDQQSLNDMVNGIQAVSGLRQDESPRREALLYLVAHGVKEQDLKKTFGEVHVSMRLANGSLRLSPWKRFRFWLLDTFGRHKR